MGDNPSFTLRRIIAFTFARRSSRAIFARHEALIPRRLIGAHSATRFPDPRTKLTEHEKARLMDKRARETREDCFALALATEASDTHQTES